MLLKTETDKTGDIVKRLTVGYAQYHNMKSGRTGHLSTKYINNDKKANRIDSRLL